MTTPSAGSLGTLKHSALKRAAVGELEVEVMRSAVADMEHVKEGKNWRGCKWHH